MSGNKCRIFFCYRQEGAEVAKHFYDEMNKECNLDKEGNNIVYGKIWMSNLEARGNYRCDISSLIKSAEIVVLFISKNFTAGFLDGNGKINTQCVTAQELLAIEKKRQNTKNEDNYRILSLNIDGYSIDKQDDRQIIEQLFRNKKILANDSVDAICSNNMNSYHIGDMPSEFHDFLECLKIKKRPKSQSYTQHITDNSNLFKESTKKSFDHIIFSSQFVPPQGVNKTEPQATEESLSKPSYSRIFISIIIGILIIGLLLSVPIGLTQSNGGQMFIAQCYDKLNKIDKAIVWYEKAADKHNNSEAQYKLGIYYFDGKSVDRSYSKAYQRFKQSAEQGYASAQFQLGYMFDTGTGVKEINEEAVKWYELALKQGGADTQNNLAIKYYRGEGVEQNYVKARELFEQSASQGVASAQFYLGLIYSNGYGVDVDYNQAVYWYTLGAEQGNSACQNNLGVLYDEGKGVEKSIPLAIEWYKKAAISGEVLSMTNLGRKYLYGTELDYAEALKWFEMAAETNNACGQYFVGKIYEEGLDVQIDLNKSLENYYLSAKQGYSDALLALKRLADNENGVAQYYLGNIYKYGYGISIDSEKACQYYLRAISRENKLAYYEVAELYEKGNGVEQSYSKAFEYYNMLASENNAKALTALGRMHYYGLGIEKNYDKAIELFRIAEAQNYPEALVCLAIAYEEGNGVGKNEYEAIDLYIKAMDLGNVQAAEKVGRYVETHIKGGYVAYKLGEFYEKMNNFEYAFDAYSAAAVRGIREAISKLTQYAYVENNDIAQVNLGMLYQNGIAVDTDYFKAKDCYLMAIEQYNDSAFYYLGALYENGLGVAKNMDEAIKYYKLAEHYGNSYASLKLREMGIN